MFSTINLYKMTEMSNKWFMIKCKGHKFYIDPVLRAVWIQAVIKTVRVKKLKRQKNEKYLGIMWLATTISIL